MSAPGNAPQKGMDMSNVHCFETTGEAYDACQCDEGIKDGDVLVIKSEGVVGVADTWPFAVTVKSGDLHSLKGDATEESVGAEKPVLAAGWRAARELAIGLGFEVKP